MLGVSEKALARPRRGVEAVAIEMAEGARRALGSKSQSRLPGLPAPVAARPTNRSASCISPGHEAIASMAIEKRFGDLGRADIRVASVSVALDMLLAALD